jgi:hypothetical protein
MTSVFGVGRWALGVRRFLHPGSFTLPTRREEFT